MAISGKQPILQKFPRRSGTYILQLHSRRWFHREIGRLGLQSFDPGWYYYVGSAFGPGGLRARLAHHLRPARRRHWHLDYLRPEMRVVKVYFSTAANRLEHEWAGILGMEGHVAVQGFGSSDCRCPAHLFTEKMNYPQRLRELLGWSEVITIPDKQAK